MRTRKKDSIQHGLEKNQMVICGLHMYYFVEYHETRKEYCRISTVPVMEGTDGSHIFMVKLESIKPYNEDDYKK